MRTEFIVYARNFSKASEEKRKEMIEDWLVDNTLGGAITSELNNEYLDWHNGSFDSEGIINMLLSHGGYLIYGDAQEAIDDLYRYSLYDLKKIMLGDKSVILIDMNIPSKLDVNIPKLENISIFSYLKIYFQILSHGSIRGSFSYLWSSLPRVFITDNRVKETHIDYIRNYFNKVIISLDEVLK